MEGLITGDLIKDNAELSFKGCKGEGEKRGSQGNEFDVSAQSDWLDKAGLVGSLARTHWIYQFCAPPLYCYYFSLLLLVFSVFHSPIILSFVSSPPSLSSFSFIPLSSRARLATIQRPLLLNSLVGIPELAPRRTPAHLQEYSTKRPT